MIPLPSEPAFATAFNPSLLFSAAAFTFLTGWLVSENIGDIASGEDPWTSDTVVSVLWVLLVAFQWWVAWGRAGTQLRPDGVHDRQPLGSLFVAWDALTPTTAATPRGGTQLTLHYRQPHRVRRRGFRPGGRTVVATGSDAGYLARVIHEYVTHPEHRPAIGTTAEQRRLTAVLDG